MLTTYHGVAPIKSQPSHQQIHLQQARGTVETKSVVNEAVAACVHHKLGATRTSPILARTGAISCSRDYIFITICAKMSMLTSAMILIQLQGYERDESSYFVFN